MIEVLELMFKRKSTPVIVESGSRNYGFSYLSHDDVYLDTACQTLRPQPVIDAVNHYYKEMNACGGRVKYAWGLEVDRIVSDTRQAVLSLLDLPAKTYSVSFTLNTTYGINLLLFQLPMGVYERVLTTDKEHNSVFLPTITAAQRLGIPRVVLERHADGSVLYDSKNIKKAVVVLNSLSNIDGLDCPNLSEFIRDVQSAEGIVIIDAAQAMAHYAENLKKTTADAICFSAHKLYAPSLGVIVAKNELINNLDTTIIGGGMVQEVHKDRYILTEGDTGSRLEPGLQAYGEIIGLHAALAWRVSLLASGELEKRVKQLSTLLYKNLSGIDGFSVINQSPSMVISGYSEKHDAHRLAKFLSEAGIMVRSGYFCCHYFLQEKQQSPPLLRFSAGLHNTEEDILLAADKLSRFVS